MNGFDKWFASKKYSQNPTSRVRGVAREAYLAGMENAAKIASKSGRTWGAVVATEIRKEAEK